MATALHDTLDAFEEISPLIGARVHLNKSDLLSGEYGEALRRLLEQRG